jgi:membrane associated rhomboid family serine protease
MVEVSVTAGKDRVPLDICIGCQFAWFDPREFEQFRKQPRPTPERNRKKLPMAAREAIAAVELESEARKQAAESDFGREPPEDLWKIIPAMLGMPVEQEVNPIGRLPWLTWSLAAAIVLTFVFTVGNLPAVVEQFGLVPARALRHGGVTLITSFFLHAGLLHLVGNVYFLIVFGDNVEDYLGLGRYWSLVFGAAVAGAVLHILCDPRSMVPCIGASGGISGIIVFYALRFPRARLGFMIHFWLIFRWFYVPAWCAMIAWFLYQAILAYLQLAGVGHVSALAHLGGAGVGLGAWLVWRERAKVAGGLAVGRG